MDSTSARSEAAASAASAGDPLKGSGAYTSAGFENRAANEPGASTTGPAAVERLWSDLSALRASLALIIAVRRDQLKLAARRAFFLSAAVGLVASALIVLAATACVMMVIGIAGGVTELLGGRVWLGQLLTGTGLIAGGGLLAFLLVRIAQSRSRRRTMERYGKINR